MTKNTPRIFISLLLMLLCIGILPVSAFTVRYRFQSEFETYAEVLEQCRNM